ncbi:hypothetical protein BFF78_08195 [Streptomyces fodineus]|uniref:Uncharacterized protein n=1 Tax=Streptomyces fodineus TaxID=1904616 RepID=A0A1D7Y679_9ACTN|nr:hypothetical protein [Streptomyces fodineus]AOR31024.1 hypothetical protein BFF78_08195 [Streptomyces fodineus]
MPAPEAPQRLQLVHQLLHRAYALLEATDDGQAPPLAELLARAVDHMPAEDRAELDARPLAWAVAEAAVQVLACTRIPIRPQDPHLASCSQALDRLPRAARTGLFTAATRRTTPDPDNAAPPTPHVPVPGRCPCPCNSATAAASAAVAGTWAAEDDVEPARHARRR